MHTDTLRRSANLLLAAAQALAPALLFSAGFTAQVARTPFAAAPNPATPAGYAFAVWGVIFAGCLAYAVFQALPGQASNPLLRKVGWWTAAGFALCVGWLLAARFGPVWLTVPVIAGMLVCLGSAFLVAARWPLRTTRATKVCVVLPLGVYAGWLSAATFVNLADVLPGYGFGRFGLDAAMFGVLVVSAAGATATAFTVASRGNLAYAATVLWALVAVWVMARSMPHAQAVAWASAAGCVLVPAAALLAWSQHRAARDRVRPA